MLIKFGSIVVGGRGKLGGQVYSHNRGGDYVRNNAIPTNPRTVFQQAGRAMLTQLSQGWSGLTDAQRQGWREKTQAFLRTNVFGDSKRLNGKNLFTSLNKNLLQVGASQLDDAPDPAAAVAPIDVDAEFDVSQGELDVTPVFDQGGTPTHLVIRATPPMSQGKKFVKNDLRVIFAGANASIPSATDLFDAYEERFGTVADHDNIYIGVYTVNASGQRTTEVTEKVTYN